MRLYWHKLFRRMEAEDAGSRPNPVVRGGAAALARVYGLGAKARRSLYTRGILQAKQLPAPVVSVGNLAVGGTGKTPMVACLARLWQERGSRVAILSRGYGGRTLGVTRVSDGQRLQQKPPEVGEEPYWLARNLPGAAVYTGANRYAAGMTAWEEFQPDLFLLDDGFQHFQLHRDLDLVLLDAAAPFGNGFLLPRGPLREPRVALEAAEVIILTRFAPERHQAQLDALHRDFPHKTILTAGIDPVRVTSYPGGHAEGLEAMRHRALVAFAGLARPGVFTSTLQEMGVDVKDFWAFPDHHVYRRQEIRDLADQARTLGAGALITTGKDWARLGEHWEGNVLLWVLEVEARLREAEGLLALLDRILKK